MFRLPVYPTINIFPQCLFPFTRFSGIGSEFFEAPFAPTHSNDRKHIKEDSKSRRHTQNGDTSVRGPRIESECEMISRGCSEGPPGTGSGRKRWERESVAGGGGGALHGRHANPSSAHDQGPGQGGASSWQAAGKPTAYPCLRRGSAPGEAKPGKGVHRERKRKTGGEKPPTYGDPINPAWKCTKKSYTKKDRQWSQSLEYEFF